MNLHQNNAAARGKVVHTGNMAVDMVYNCIQHYKKFGKRVKIVTLSHKYWRSFERYLKEQDETFEFKDQVEFKHLLVRKGSFFQTTHLIPELEAPAVPDVKN